MRCRSFFKKRLLFGLSICYSKTYIKVCLGINAFCFLLTTGKTSHERCLWNVFDVFDMIWLSVETFQCLLTFTSSKHTYKIHVYHVLISKNVHSLIESNVIFYKSVSFSRVTENSEGGVFDNNKETEIWNKWYGYWLLEPNVHFLRSLYNYYPITTTKWNIPSYSWKIKEAADILGRYLLLYS